MMSGLSIISALALLGGTAFAVFTASATATNNTFSSATPSLLINTYNGDGFLASTVGFSAGGLIPGGSTAPQVFTLKNDNSGAALPVTLKLNNLPANTLPGSDVTITVECPANPAVVHSYADWISTGYAIGTVANNGNLDCTMIVKLNSGVGNEDAGKAAVFDAVFTGTEGD